MTLFTRYLLSFPEQQSALRLSHRQVDTLPLAPQAPRNRWEAWCVQCDPSVQRGHLPESYAVLAVVAFPTA